MKNRKFKIWHAVLICLAVFFLFGALAAFTLRTEIRKSDENFWNIFNWRPGTVLGPVADHDIDQMVTFSADEVAALDSISLNSVSTTINVTTGGSELSAHLYGNYRSNGEIDLKASQTGNKLTIKTDYTKATHTMYSELHFDIVIPEDYTGDLLVKSVSGTVKLDIDDLDLDTLDINSVSGTIDLSDVAANDVNLRSVSGRVEVEDINGSQSVNIYSTSGKIRSGVLSGDIKAKSTSGSIDIESDGSGDMDISNTSGDVQITLPEGSGFDVDYASVSGSFNCELPLTIQSNSKRHFQGTHGDGGQLIAVNTVSGDCNISIR